ncbi:MAG: family 10 glycosylhydrolase [Victivallaceae bacterium]|nr:family 10 glycosylhydrolase [Victivallaceae bacterium]
MNFRRLGVLLATLIALPLCAEKLCKADGTPVSWGGKIAKGNVFLPPPAIQTTQFRGIWVATVKNIDFGPFANAAEFRAAAKRMMKNIAAQNFNAVIFQVRPNNDAWYASKINPWSRNLSGKEGVGIGVDPLKILIDEAHKNHLEFHAWLNPYRVIGSTNLSKRAYLAQLAPGNFAKMHPDLVLAVPVGKGELSLLLNPGEPQVMRHIADTVGEIVKNYPVDAIHFDDYFYLYTDLGNADAFTFARYAKGQKNIGDWRRDNVTTVICKVRATIQGINRKYGKNVAFGISPFGIWANRATRPEGSCTGGKECYTTLFADVRLWIKKGYIDYVIPQLYWGFAHQTAAYAALTDWWSEQVKGTNVRLFTGHGLYCFGRPQEFPENEIYNQFRYNLNHQEVTGFSLFSYHNFFAPEDKRIQRGVRKLKTLMTKPAKCVTYPNCR